MSDNQLNIIYDKLTYDKSEINKIVKKLDINSDIEIKELHNKALDGYAILLLIFIGPPLYWFSKSFFSKLGERCADSLFNNKSEKNPNISIKFISQDNRKINIHFKPESQNDIENNINDEKIKSAYDEVEEYLGENENITDFNIALNNNGEIDGFFYFDKDKNIYSSKKPNKK